MSAIFGKVKETPMEAKYTPGPWTIEQEADDDYSIVNRLHLGIDWDVCTVHSTKSNAHLIAAAPDMYHALRSILHMIEYAHPADAKIVTDALNKAEGRP